MNLGHQTCEKDDSLYDIKALTRH